MVLDNCTYLHELYRLISSCVIPDMASLPNPGLNDALDSQEQTGALLPEGQRVDLTNNDQRAAASHDYYGNLQAHFGLIKDCACCNAHQAIMIVCRGAHGSFDSRRRGCRL